MRFLLRRFIRIVLPFSLVIAVYFIWTSAVYYDKNTEAGEINSNVSPNYNGLAVQLWFDLCIVGLQSLCIHPLFPKAPMKEFTIDRLQVRRNHTSFAQRIFGYIHPPVTGEYTFYVTSDDSSEVWLSRDMVKKNSRKICSVGERDGSLSYTLPTEFDKFPSQKSNPIHLIKGQQYYFEIIHMQVRDDDHLEVAWVQPGEKNLSIIDHHVSSIANEPTNESPLCLTSPHHHNIRSISEVEQSRYIDHAAVSQALPYCKYKPSYRKPVTPLMSNNQPLWRFKTTQFVPIYVFPYMVTQGIDNLLTYDSYHLEPNDAKRVTKMYMEQLSNRYKGEYALSNIINVEKKPNGEKGSRYLLELNVTLLQNNNKTSILSEYIYHNKFTDQLCYPEDLAWNRRANITIVICLRNLGSWFKHFLDNLQFIYVTTKDENISLLVFDFDSEDIDLRVELEKRILPPYKLIKRSGIFSKRIALNTALRSLQDNHTIAFLFDLHLEIPITIFDDARKHCVEGKSVYTPIITRLKCGKTPADPAGYWEQQGFGIIALYKSDWDRIGGLNEKSGTYLWGSEDWELMENIVSRGGLEYERLKNFKMFHFKHSKKGLWTGDKNFGATSFSD